MTVSTISVFERSIHTANTWLEELAEELHVEDRQRAYQALRGVLHALRDRLTVDEAAHLSAQLPLLVRGVYFEAWKPAHKPEKIRTLPEWLELVVKKEPALQQEDPERCARAVFAVLERHVTAGEIRDIVRMVPEPVRALWPQRPA